MSVSDNPTGSPEPAPRLVACHCLAVRQAARRITQLYDQALAPLGLRVTQFSILAVLREIGPISMGALADRLVMDRATLGHNLGPLETQGLVGRSVGNDRRSRLVTVTDRGAALVEAARPLWRDAQVSFEQAFGKQRARDLRATLGQVATLDFAGSTDGA